MEGMEAAAASREFAYLQATFALEFLDCSVVIRLGDTGLMGSRRMCVFAVQGPFGTYVCFVRIVSSSKLGRLSFLRPLCERLFHSERSID